MLTGLANILIVAAKNILALGIDIRVVDFAHHSSDGVSANRLHRGRYFCTAVNHSAVNRQLWTRARANQCDCCVALSGGCRVVINRIN